MSDNSHNNMNNGAAETAVPGAGNWSELQGLVKSRQIVKIKMGKLARNSDKEVVGVQFTHLGERGFTPESSLATGTTPQSAAGKYIEVVFTEAEPARKGGKGGRLIASQKLASIRRKLELLAKGMKVTGTVHKVIDDGVLVALKQIVGAEGVLEGDLTDVVGLVFKSAVTNERDADLKALLPEGTPVTAVITGLDPLRERVSLSIKAVALDEQLAALEVETDVSGKVVSVSKEHGYFVNIGALDALLNHAQAGGQTFEVGETITATVLSVNHEKKQVGLTKLSKEERERRSKAAQRKRSGGDSRDGNTRRDNQGRGGSGRKGSGGGRRDGGNTGSSGTSSDRRIARATPKTTTSTSVTTGGGSSKKKVKHAPPARSRKGEVVFSSSTHSNPFEALAAYMSGRDNSNEGTSDATGTTEIAANVEPIIEAVAPAAGDVVVTDTPPAAEQQES